MGRTTEMENPKFSSEVGVIIIFLLKAGEPGDSVSYDRMCEELKACMYNFYKHHILEPEYGRACPFGAMPWNLNKKADIAVKLPVIVLTLYPFYNPRCYRDEHLYNDKCIIGNVIL